MQSKAVYFFGVTSTATTHTLSSSGVGGIQDAKTFYNRCNVLLAVGTFTGAGTMMASFQERFSDLGFVETASSTLITGTGNYWLLRDPANPGSINSNSTGGNAAMGTGTDKQIVFTGGSMSTFGVRAYIVFHQN